MILGLKHVGAILNVLI